MREKRKKSLSKLCVSKQLMQSLSSAYFFMKRSRYGDCFTLSSIRCRIQFKSIF